MPCCPDESRQDFVGIWSKWDAEDYTNTLGLAVAYEYEPLRDHKTLGSNAWDTNVISTFAYDYDAVGRRTQQVDSGLTTNVFAYNTRSELINAVMGTNTYSYAYDPIGNRTSASENGTTNVYASNELNQYTSLNPASPNPTPFTYGPDGNMTSDGTWSYAWDAENRLIEVQPLATNLDSTLLQFMYDAQSRRIARREFVWTPYLGGSITWRYVQGLTYRYDGWNLLQELKPPATPRTPPTYIPQTNLYLTGVTGPVAAQYVWGLDLASTLQGAGGIGGLLMQRHSDTNAPWFSFCDANGNITDLQDEDGMLVVHYDYDSYGKITIQSGDLGISNSFRFSSKSCNCERGAYYFGYRFYWPVLGRWIDRDPLGENIDGSLFGYVENSPVSHVDPLGLIPLGGIAVGCLMDIAKELLMQELDTKWDQFMGCSKLDRMAAIDPNFDAMVCKGFAFDMELPSTYNGKTMGQILLTGVLKTGLNKLLNQAVNPLEQKFIKSIIDNSVDVSVNSIMKKVDVDGKIRMYSFCKDKMLHNVLNYRTTLTYEGISLSTTDISNPFSCENCFLFSHINNPCSCCNGNH